jgi:hypothetical protein
MYTSEMGEILEVLVLLLENKKMNTWDVRAGVGGWTEHPSHGHSPLHTPIPY